MTILDIALAWLAAGVAVIPARIDGSKAPLGTWRQYIERLPEKDQVVSWFRDGHPGMGLVCGAVSGGLEMVELEGRAIDKVPELQTLAADAGLGGLLNRVMTGYVERTPSGGLHMLYRISDGPVAGNTKLARDSDGLVLAETRGEGGFVIIAPSNGATHPSGKPWTTIVGDAGTVPTLTSDEADDLRGLFRCLDETAHPELGASPGPALPPTPRSQTPTALGIGVGISPGDDYEDRTGWADILEPHGWRQIFTRGQVVYWRRPGKDTGVSATTGRASDRDRLYVFSSSTPFRTELPYTRFAAFATLNHGGDYAAAASGLKARGYGRAPVAPTLTSLAGALSASVGQDQASTEPQVTLRDRMRARLYDRDGLDTIPAPTPLIADVLDVATIAVLAGKFGTYKTFVSVAWACSVATGTDWFGHVITTPGTVLYVAGEGGNGLKQRVRAWEVGHLKGERVPAARFLVYDGRIKLNNPAEVDVLAEFITDNAPVLTVIDTLHKCAPGVDEDNARDMSLILDVAVEIRETFGTTVLFNHHTGHSGMRSRGTSSIEDDADTCWLVRLDGDNEDRSAANARILVHRKSKNSVLCDDVPLGLRVVADTGSAHVEPAPEDFIPGGLVITVLAGKLDAAEIPRDLSVRKTQEAGSALGLKQRSTTWAEVAKFRARQGVGDDE